MKLSETVKSLKEKYSDFKKKRYIKSEMTKLFNYRINNGYSEPISRVCDRRLTVKEQKREINGFQKNYVDMISTALFDGAKMVHAEVVYFNNLKLERENTVVVNKIRSVIDQHYKEVDNKRKSVYKDKESKLNQQIYVLNNDIERLKREKEEYAKKNN